MTPPAADQRPAPVPDSVLSIPEIRDYDRINAELVSRLDAGQAYVRLIGAEGQRLLLAGLSGAWSAQVEIEGETGPELAAALEAPGLTVVARGATGDGAARGLRAGRVILLGAAGDALAYGQEGGTVLAAAGAGHRAGLAQRGGSLVVLGPVGRLAGERQAGGRLFAVADRLGPHAGHARRGGSLLRLAPEAESAPDFGIAPEDAEILRTLLREAGPWIGEPRRSPEWP
jgi:methylamine---glutamate N-methyltransferase subunit B